MARGRDLPGRSSSARVWEGKARAGSIGRRICASLKSVPETRWPQLGCPEGDSRPQGSPACCTHTGVDDDDEDHDPNDGLEADARHTPARNAERGPEPA